MKVQGIVSQTPVHYVSWRVPSSPVKLLKKTPFLMKFRTIIITQPVKLWHYWASTTVHLTSIFPWQHLYYFPYYCITGVSLSEIALIVVGVLSGLILVFGFIASGEWRVLMSQKVRCSIHSQTYYALQDTHPNLMMTLEYNIGIVFIQIQYYN